MRIAIGATPYSLVYGDEVVIPLEISSKGSWSQIGLANTSS